MKVGIDARFASYRRGIGNYAYHLITELTRIRNHHQFVVYADASMAADDLAKWAAEGSRVHVYPSYPYVLWEQVFLPRWAARDGLDLLHCPGNTGPLTLPRCVKVVLTLHDVMYLLPHTVVPQSMSPYQRLGRVYRRVVAPRVAARAQAIIADSDHTRNDVANRLGIPPVRIRVIHPAPDAAFRPLPRGEALDDVKRRYGLRDPMLLAMGAVDPRKNTLGILRAFALARQQGALRHQLVIVGLPRSVLARFVRLASALGVEEDVVFLDFVPNDMLVKLYNAATIFLYPSFYEGFGFPVLEAMACGVPVIASTAGSVPEIAGDAALFVRPDDIHGLGRAIVTLAADESLRQTLVRKGAARAATFSWERTAAATMRVYDECGQ